MLVAMQGSRGPSGFMAQKPCLVLGDAGEFSGLSLKIVGHLGSDNLV